MVARTVERRSRDCDTLAVNAPRRQFLPGKGDFETLQGEKLQILADDQQVHCVLFS